MRSSLYWFICFFLMISPWKTLAIPVLSLKHASNYLTRFGYLKSASENPTLASSTLGNSLKKAISEFQAFVGIRQTGVLDRETMKWMNKPRCGLKDKFESGATTRQKRYERQGSRWQIRNLAYHISKYPSDLKRSDVDKEIARAFQVWSNVTNLTFATKQPGYVHIEIRFERREHGDTSPFDGSGGTLAHAYFPMYGGDVHFDSEEVWTINSYRGVNLFEIAAHEFGHSLGLSHSDVRAALMFPYYSGYKPHFKLHQDDISGIQALYGRKTHFPRRIK